MPLPRIAIALGDPAGIGPEIALKAALHPEVRELCVPILVGDRGVLQLHAAACGLAPPLIGVEPEQMRALEVPEGSVALLKRNQLGHGQLKLGQIDAAHGRAILDSAAAAINCAVAGQVDAVVAAPRTDLAISQAGIRFDGYPTFVAAVTGVPRDQAYLMLCVGEQRIVHVTLHVSVRQALAMITAERVEHAVRATDTALRRLGLAAPRIAVSGINPHAGQDGMFGVEEATIIGPAIGRLKAAGLDVEGPYSADTLFARPGFDACVVMLHDQGHVAAQTMAPNRVANLTIGTPVLFASIAQDSALELAGKNQARPDTMIEAIRRLARVGAPLAMSAAA